MGYKKVVLGLALILATCGSVNAESSEPYEFTIAVIEALHMVDFAIDAIDNSENDLVGHTQGIHTCNYRLQRAKSSLAGYKNSKNETMREIADVMTKSINFYIEANQKSLNLVSSVENFSDPAKAASVTGGVNADRIQALSTLVEVSTYVIGVWAEVPKTDNPTGKIPFLMSPHERTEIGNRINALFGEDLKAFREWSDSKDENKDTFHNGRIMLAVDHIDKSIEQETY